MCLVWLGTRFVSCQVKLWTFFDPFRCVFRFSLWGSRGHGVFFQSWDHANVKRSGCCFGFRGNYSGILPAKFRILHKFAALAGSFFDKFVRFSLFTDPSWGKLCRPIQPSLAFVIFAFWVVSRRLHWGPSAVQFQVAEFIVLFPGHHPRAWLWSVVGGTIDCKAARVAGQGVQVVEVVAIWSLQARWSCVELASVVRLRGIQAVEVISGVDKRGEVVGRAFKYLGLQ